MSNAVLPLRSLLFVPGNRPDRFGKAAISGADGVCLDLEDAIPADEKPAARRHVLEYLQQTSTTRAIPLTVRVNALHTPDGLRDMLALAEASHAPDALLLTKVRHPQEAALVLEALGPRVPLLCAMIENARGLLCAARIAARCRGGLMFGPADLAADLEVASDAPTLEHARAQVVIAARSAGVPALDGPCLDLHSETTLKAEADRARELGFTGKAIIHPRQISAVHAAFRPTSDEVARARRGLEAFAAAGGGPAMLDGRFIDAPVVAGFRHVLARAARDAT